MVSAPARNITEILFPSNSTSSHSSPSTRTMKAPSRTFADGVNVRVPSSFALIMMISELSLVLTSVPVTTPPVMVYGTQLPNTDNSDLSHEVLGCPTVGPVTFPSTNSIKTLLLFSELP